MEIIKSTKEKIKTFGKYGSLIILLFINKEIISQTNQENEIVKQGLNNLINCLNYNKHLNLYTDLIEENKNFDEINFKEEIDSKINSEKYIKKISDTKYYLKDNELTKNLLLKENILNDSTLNEYMNNIKKLNYFYQLELNNTGLDINLFINGEKIKKICESTKELFIKQILIY